MVGGGSGRSLRAGPWVRQTLWLRTALLAGTAALLVGPGVPPWGYAVVLASAAVAAGTPAYPALMAAMPTVGSGSARRASGLLVTVEVASFVVGPAVGAWPWAGSLRPLCAWWEPGSAPLRCLPCAAYASPLW